MSRNSTRRVFLSDVDECAEGSHNCHVNAACSNIKGSFQCTCDVGYTGNGITCLGTFDLNFMAVFDIFNTAYWWTDLSREKLNRTRTAHTLSAAGYRKVPCLMEQCWLSRVTRRQGSGTVFFPSAPVERHRGNMHLTSLPFVSVRRHGRVTQWKSR